MQYCPPGALLLTLCLPVLLLSGCGDDSSPPPPPPSAFDVSYDMTENDQLSDALDATKEIANMIAGTIKSSLPRPCTMTVPESALEPEGFNCGAATGDSLMVAFHHPAGALVVRIWEQECTAA